MVPRVGFIVSVFPSRGLVIAAETEDRHRPDAIGGRVVAELTTAVEAPAFDATGASQRTREFITIGDGRNMAG